MSELLLLTASEDFGWPPDGALTVRLVQAGDNFRLECRYRCTPLQDQYGKRTLRWRVGFPSDSAHSLVEKLCSARIPAAPMFPEGLDGRTYSLAVGAYMGSAVYRWWSKAPEGWEPLVQVHAILFNASDCEAQLEIRRTKFANEQQKLSKPTT